MVSVYYIAYLTLAILLMAFLPAMIAATRQRSFSKWYIYGVVLFPVAFVHSLFLKKPIYRINVYRNDFNKRTKKCYTRVTNEEKKITIYPKYIYIVFFSKLIFGAFLALSLFALFRTFVFGTESLKRACIVFAVLFSVLLSVVEILRFSRFPMMADEITKRALVIMTFSVIASLPLFALEKFVFNPLLPQRVADFISFVCTIISFAVFVAILLKKQRVYYSAFSKFSDYCVLSMCAYAIFAACTLIWMSIADIRGLVYAVAMPMQLFNLDYLSGVEVIEKMPYIYSAAFVHLVMEVVIFVSGLLCHDFKKKELAYKIEYRSKAFRMSRKMALRRHIPKIEKPILK